MPTLDVLESSPEALQLLSSIEGRSTSEKLTNFIGKLSSWDAVGDTKILGTARQLIQIGRTGKPVVLDTFAGGGSIPLEALRLGADAAAGDLNPVAVAALRLALCYLPKSESRIVDHYYTISKKIESHLRETTSLLYEAGDGEPLAFFWCRTIRCSCCNKEVPLMQNKWLSQKGEKVAVKILLSDEKDHCDFLLYSPTTEKEVREASQGTISQKSAECVHCGKKISTSMIMREGTRGRIGERLYAKLMKVDGKRLYVPVRENDHKLLWQAAANTQLNGFHTEIPDLEFDLNSVRHIWAMQYGVTSTSALYNERQKIALINLLNILEQAKSEIESTEHIQLEDRRALVTLLAVHLNRVVMYSNRHVWWQPNGAFPANIFTRQAIPMVWNYVEIPVTSPGAGGWASAGTWLDKVCKHLAALDNKGSVWQGDAARIPLSDMSVDLVAIDPPYYDSITYAYLADVFHTWTRLLLKDTYEEFQQFASPKIEEAIVDRPHKSSPSPKDDAHFRQKMLAAFREANRVLKSEGTLMVMYGHKKTVAWGSFLESLLASGFTPVSSWPINTERKSKFNHARVASLSSSCLIVCKKAGVIRREDILWKNFVLHLSEVLHEHVSHWSEEGVSSSELGSVLIAPAVSYFATFNVQDEKGKAISMDDFLLKLPVIISEAELEILLQNKTLETLTRLYDSTKEDEPIAQTAGAQKSLVTAVRAYTSNFKAGRYQEADNIWQVLDRDEKLLGRDLLHYIALTSRAGSEEERIAHASIGRMSATP